MWTTAKGGVANAKKGNKGRKGPAKNNKREKKAPTNAGDLDKDMDKCKFHPFVGFISYNNFLLIYFWIFFSDFSPSVQ
jgi:hypothetical protein